MSQAGILDIESANPQIPTSFITDDGSAIPLSNQLELLGDTVPNATFPEPVWTTASGNTVEINVQVGAAITGAPVDNNDAGLVSFDDTVFDVDANGYVTLIGGGSAIDSIAVQTGTSPVVPNGAGIITINGAVVAAGTNPVRSDGTGANTLAIEVQRSQAAASTSANIVGLSSFDSADFSVDANGFVSLAGAGAGQTITGNDLVALSPTAGNWNIVGTGSLTTSGLGSTLTTSLTGLTNHAVLIGAGTATITKVGPTATAGQVLQSAGASADPAFSTATYPLTTTINQLLYSSATNTITGLATANRAVLTTGATGVPVLTALAVDGQLIIGSTAGVPAAATLTAGTGISITNGSNSISIAVNGASVGQTITGDTGGALSPTAGNWNILSTATNGIDVAGSGSTLTVGMASPYADASFAFSRAASGATNTLTIANTSNTASSAANMQVTVGGATAADPQTTYTVTGATSWSTGIDNSVSDNFVIAASTALGTSNAVSINTAGAMSVTSNLTTMGDFDATRSSVGGLVNGVIQNADNTNAASNAAMSAVTGGASSGDPYFGLSISGVTGYSMGIDNSDSDRLKITSSFVGPSAGNTFVSMATTGEINYPLQPAFLARANAQSSVTGDGTTYSVIFANEIFDQNADFDGTSTFTAPVTGRYQISILFALTTLGAAHLSFNGSLVTSNRTYFFDNCNPFVQADGGTAYKSSASILADLDSADTAIVQVQVSGGTKVVGISASASFSAFLAC